MIINTATDMVALPDFGAGAMENWGMITYRERDLLYNNATYGSNNLQRTTIVVAHELAHQVFLLGYIIE